MPTASDFIGEGGALIEDSEDYHYLSLTGWGGVLGGQLHPLAWLEPHPLAFSEFSKHTITAPTRIAAWASHRS